MVERQISYVVFELSIMHDSYEVFGYLSCTCIPLIFFLLLHSSLTARWGRGCVICFIYASDCGAVATVFLEHMAQVTKRAHASPHSSLSKGDQ